MRPEPVAPDLALGADAGAVTLLELQLDPDERKRLRWPLAVAQVSDARREMCDLVVLTPFEAVARWARRIRLVGPLGTRLVLQPVVVHVDEAMIEAILNGPADLAFFAAWAVSRRYGKRATQVVHRALARTVELPGDQRDRQESAILAMMNPRLAATLKEAKMNSDPFLTPQAIELRQVLRAWEARGVARALLTVLAARGWR